MLRIRIADYDLAQILEMKNDLIQLYSLALYDVFKMIITKLFYFDLSEKIFCQKVLGSKKFWQKLRHQVVEAETLTEEAEGIQKLPLPHP